MARILNTIRNRAAIDLRQQSDHSLLSRQAAELSADFGKELATFVLICTDANRFYSMAAVRWPGHSAGIRETFPRPGGVDEKLRHHLAAAGATRRRDPDFFH